MNRLENLAALRQHWYAAYFAADLVFLKATELPDFTYLSDQGIETTDRRYSHIADRVASGTWFASAAHRQELSVSYHDQGECCYVTGTARIVAAPGVEHKRCFSELWLSNKQNWQILSLHASVLTSG